MYMRFFRVRIREDRLPDFLRFYERRVEPALHASEGCLYAALLQRTTHPDECAGLSLWERPDQAEAWQGSPAFRELLAEAQPYLHTAGEWKLQLADEAGGRGTPGMKGAVVEGYSVEATAAGGDIGLPSPGSPLFVRFVRVDVAPGRFAEFRDRYSAEVIPELMATPGCRGAFLVEGIKHPDRALSVSLWESEEAAVRYEMSGAFDELTRKLRDLFSGVYQWRVTLGGGASRPAVTGRDLDISGYQVVTGWKA